MMMENGDRDQDGAIARVSHEYNQPLRVLCVDGGGVKGCAAASFLERLDASLGATGSRLKNKFDVFCGTSSGAMFVAALVYGDMSPTEILSEMYTHDTCRRVFPRTLHEEAFGLMSLQPKYDGRGKRQLINDVIAPDKRLCDTDKMTIFTGYDVDKRKCMIYRSWDREVNHMLVRDVIDISSAAPAYFPIAVTTSVGEHVRGVDGAVFANNPTDLCYAELLDHFSASEDMRILSVGTGILSVPMVESSRDQQQGRRPPDDDDSGANSVTRGPDSRMPTNAGGIQWMLHGTLFSLLYEAPQEAVDLRMGVFADALGHQYIRVNGEVSSSKIDDTSATNLAALRSHGVEWWNRFGPAVWKKIFLDESEDDSSIL